MYLHEKLRIYGSRITRPVSMGCILSLGRNLGSGDLKKQRVSFVWNVLVYKSVTRQV